MSALRILDCTLRDGGFYTNWTFELDFVRALVEALDDAGVAIIELGYRSPRRNGRAGIFKHCDEDLLSAYVPRVRRAQLAFMIDVKDVLCGAGVDTALLAHLIAPRDESRFAWGRVATHPETARQALEIVRWLHSRGYATALNLMGASTLEPPALARLLGLVDPGELDVLYLADSLGSLTPPQTTSLVASTRGRFAGDVGVHLHDNLGLALANALAAVDAGATYVDSTAAGMGRGAGNVRTEQLLAVRGQRADALVPLLAHDLRRLHEQYRWGPSYPYMMSALGGIHPSYCQELEARGDYGLDDIVETLGAIAHDKRGRFDPSALAAAEARRAGRELHRRSS
jgi:4-hydroxy 2-oxovalerate aldolase